MNIKSTKDVESFNIRALIYGVSGIGKTSTALTLNPKETLIIDVEGGLLPLRGQDFDVVTVNSWDELLDVWMELRSQEKSKYKTIFIDSLTEIAELAKIHIVTVERPDVRGKIDKIYNEQLDIKDWSLYTDKMRKMVRCFRDLEYNVIFTSLEETEKDEKTGALMFYPSLPGKKFAHQSLPGFFDEVFRLISVDAEGKTERYFLTEVTERSFGKDRSGTLDRLEPLNWSNVFKKIKSKKENKEKK